MWKMSNFSIAWKDFGPIGIPMHALTEQCPAYDQKHWRDEIPAELRNKKRQKMIRRLDSHLDQLAVMQF
jgi:hypothetical protein